MTKHNNVIVKAFAYIWFYLKTIILMTVNNYDYVYVHYISHSSWGVLYAMHFVKDTKIVFNAHGNDVVADTKRDLKNIPRSKKYLKSAYKVIVPSKYYEEVMVEDYGVNAKDVIVYPSGGIDVELFNKFDSVQAKQNIYLDPKNKYIGYVSRIDADKGYDTFVEAVNILSKDKKYNKYQFLVVGNGSEYKNLEKLVNDYGLSERITLIKTVERVDLPSLYNSLDLFVFPTRRKSDSLGLVGLEAMACETLTITSNARGPLSYAKNKMNAYVFKQDDPEDLVNAIETVLSLDDDAKDKLRKNARKTAMEYDSTKMDSILFKAFK
jgi:glycosyltransferase involved in cell wall biosynthesis